MKKVFLTVAIVAAAVLGMTSCSNKEKCWEIKATSTFKDGTSLTATAYFWGTKNELNVQIDNAKKAAEEEEGKFKVNSKKSVKAADQKECLAKNVEDLF